MSSLRERVSLAVSVFREDPDEVVTLSEDGGRWTAVYRAAEHTADTEADALGDLFVHMKWVRDREFREKCERLKREGSADE